MSEELKEARNLSAPIRIVHIGLGAFHKAHQAWYTMKVDSENQWGIAAFTGRKPDEALKLEAQGNQYTVITRGPQEDEFEAVTSIVRAHDIDDFWQLKEYLSDSNLAILSLTITESGYLLNLNGGLDRSNSFIDEDLENLDESDYVPHSIIFKIAAGLVKRYRLHGKPIAIMSCDNLSGNGVRLQAGMSEIFSYLPTEIDQWFKANVTFPSTSVDRITPKITETDIALVKSETGLDDRAPVVTEPFSSWIIQGSFPAGRPAWEKAGAQFVDDIESFENRKLWLLNGSHSLMAYAGLTREYSTVAEALNDAQIRALIEGFWIEASSLLTAPNLHVDEYKAALISRYENHRIEHKLKQIAIDGGTKLVMRVVPVALEIINKGEMPTSCALVIGEWIHWLQNQEEVFDTRLSEIKSALSSEDPIKSCVALLSAKLSENNEFVAIVRSMNQKTESKSA
jgi:fructuronate reductase